MKRRPLRFIRLEDRCTPAVATWDGGGTNNFWSTAANWTGDVVPNPGDDLVFPNTALQVISRNDLAAGTAFGQIHITGGGYYFFGNRINLSGGIRIEAPGQFGNIVVAAFEIPLTLTNHQMISGDFNSPFAIQGSIDLNGFGLQVDVAAFAANSIVSGVISGIGGLTKTGSGVLELWAINTFTGPTVLDQGSLQVERIIPGPVTQNANTNLSGTGTIGALTSTGGIVQPGSVSPDLGIVTPGTLGTGNLNLQAGSHLSITLSEQGLGRLNVQGTVNLAGSLFVGFGNSPNPVRIGESVTILQNDGSDPVVGTFANIPEGTIVAQGAVPLRITYHGGDGNDVAVIGVSQATFAVAAGTGGFPIVNVYDAEGGLIRSFFAYQQDFRGGVHVTTADVTNDLVPDVITAPGPGGGPVIRVWNGATGAMVREFNAYDPAFRGGVWLATARVVPTSIQIITGAGPGGGPHVKLFDGPTGAEVGSFFAFDAEFRGGITVAGTDGQTIHFGSIPGQVIVGAGVGGFPIVRTFSGAVGTPVSAFYAYDPSFRGGVNVATGSFIGFNDIATAPMSAGGPVVRIFSNPTTASLPHELRKEFLAYTPAFTGGVTIGARAFNIGLPATLITGAGYGGGPHVETWSFPGDNPTLDLSFLAFDPAFTGGVFVG